MPSKFITCECSVCGAGFERLPFRYRATCGRKCADTLRASASSATQTKKLTLVCHQCGRSKLVSPVYATRRFCSPKCAYAFQSGPNSTNWKGGLTSERQQFFTSQAWKKVCNRVWARERGRCQRCRVVHKKPAKPHEVHHVGSWNKFPALRMDLDNLVLLCHSCHRHVHSRRNVKREFIRRKTLFD